MRTLFFVAFFYFVSVVYSDPDCRFAFQFKQRDLFSQSTQDKFLEAVAFWEANFHQNSVGINEATGCTYDGHEIDIITGQPVAPLHDFSAASKESLHLMMLARALEGNKYAKIFISPSNPQNATSRALEILQKKMKSFLDWNRKYPGFGGYLPWVKVSDTGLEPTNGWGDRVPSLDNGEMVWGLYSVAIQAQKTVGNTEQETQALRAIGEQYRSYFDMLAKNSVMMFYDGKGHVRAEAKILDVHAQPTPGNYRNNVANYFLDDPYEGELFVFFMDLFGNWPNTTHDERDAVWKVKRTKLVAVDYPAPNGPITVQKGWWFSSHETWKVMELPYNNVPIHNRVFRNGEKVRTINSLLHNNPGLYAAASNFTSGGPIQQYVNTVGIPQIAFEPIKYYELITPYGAFPVSIANLSVGLIWYHNMLLGSKMQGPFGSTEACQIGGKAIAPVLTWDTKITNLCAFIGGITDLVRTGLQQQQKYQRFYEIVDREWTRVFTNLKGEANQFALPHAPVPRLLADFTT